MARTDAHRPLYVLEADEPQRFQECHNHSRGICDLPPPGNPWIRTGCYRNYIDQKRLCCCSWCGGGIYRRRELRWERHVTKQILTDALKTADWEDLDVWPKHWREF